MTTLQVGDIALATYSYSSQHNYWLLVTKRTAKTVSFVRLERTLASHDGYGQNGEELPLLVDGKPVPRTDQLSQPDEYKNKRIQIDYNGNESAKIGDYISRATKWDGVSTASFYTD
jgi:hypothetical protein